MENIGALAILLAFCLAVYAVIGSVVGALGGRFVGYYLLRLAIYSFYLLCGLVLHYSFGHPGIARLANDYPLPAKVTDIILFVVLCLLTPVLMFLQFRPVVNLPPIERNP